jgi:hypothetical protein
MEAHACYELCLGAHWDGLVVANGNFFHLGGGIMVDDLIWTEFSPTY